MTDIGRGSLVRFGFVAVLILAGICGAAPEACGQVISPLQTRNEFGVWGSATLDNPRLIGTTTGWHSGTLAFRYGRTIFASRSVSLEYTLDVIPAVAIVQPVITSFQFTSPPRRLMITEKGHEAIYGAGIDPVGFKLNFLRRRSWQPFVAATGGFLATTRPIPIDVPGAAQFNFAFDFQAGIEHFNSSRSRAWMFGYKLQHISNANRSQINPGVDSNIIFVGYSLFK